MGLTALALAAGETALPAVLGRAVDAVVGHGASRSWVMWCGGLIALLVTVDFVDDLASGAMTATSTAWLRRTLVHHLLRTNPRTDALSSGDVVNRLVGNTADVGRIGSEVVRAVAAVVPAVGGTVALGLINVWLLVTFLLGLPVTVLIVRTFARDASELAARYLHEQGRIAARLGDALGGARTVAAAGTQGREVRRVLAPLPELHNAGVEMWRAQARILTKDAALVPLLEVAVLSVAGVQLSSGRITVGEMLAASQYVLLAATLSSAVGIVLRLARSRAAASRAAEILALPTMTYGNCRLPRGRGHIEFRGVTAHAGNDVVLDGLDLDVPAGVLVAVVGPSGSGKSTLAELVGRMVDPVAGEVLLDGVRLHDLSHDALRKAVTYGFEAPTLIGETLSDAIAFGVRRPPSREIKAAARAARADSFIQQMPDGYATALTEAPMSGGERQRVGLARTFAHAGRVIVLDDVASRLDTVTEHHIAEVLTSPRFTQTRIMVAHRASTAARADLVVWLERGRLRSLGQHHQLWAESPDYRRLFEPAGGAAVAAGARRRSVNGTARPSRV